MWLKVNHAQVVPFERSSQNFPAFEQETHRQSY